MPQQCRSWKQYVVLVSFNDRSGGKRQVQNAELNLDLQLFNPKIALPVTHAQEKLPHS